MPPPRRCSRPAVGIDVVVNLGTGTGALAHRVAKAATGIRLVGIDEDQGMLAHGGAAAAPSAHNPGVRQLPEGRAAALRRGDGLICAPPHQAPPGKDGAVPPESGPPSAGAAC